MLKKVPVKTKNANLYTNYKDIPSAPDFNGSLRLFNAKDKKNLQAFLDEYKDFYLSYWKAKAVKCQTIEEKVTFLKAYTSDLVMGIYGGLDQSLLSIDPRKTPFNMLSAAIPGVVSDQLLRKLLAKYDAAHLVEITKEDIKARVAARKANYFKHEKTMPNRVMTSEGEIFKGSYDTSEIPKGALAGTSVSGGIVEGYVRVILDPKKETLQKGEILVTKFADPGWTPLFVLAGGMALNVGGTMTHSAIVAREYNIPAVVGIDNVTEKLKTGDYVRINADKGYIEKIT